VTREPLDPNHTVLLVEDHEDDVSLLRGAFKHAGCENLQVVRNGDEAINYLEGEGKYSNRRVFPCPVLIMLDLKMPGRSGFEVVQWVRANCLYKRMPIVILTDSAHSDDVNCAYDMGINSYLIKPVAFEDLVHVVKAFVEYWLMFSKHPTYPAPLEVC
jgi:DNA-binding response OmpR family regulator